MGLKKICYYIGLVSTITLLIQLFVLDIEDVDGIMLGVSIGGTAIGLGLWAVLDNVDKDFD